MIVASCAAYRQPQHDARRGIDLLVDQVGLELPRVLLGQGLWPDG